MGKKSGDYHNDMNQRNFMEWADTQLLPNLPLESVLIIHNAPYHNVAVEKSVTTASKKAEMLKWLEDRNVQFEENLIKPELYALIKQHKPRFSAKYR